MAGYTLAHAGRQIRLGPIAFWVIVGTLVIMAVWTITTATYFAFREDVLTRLIARQAEMQFGYEDRITELRAQVDRISSRQLLDQEQYEEKLDQILRWQATLESRTSTLSGLGDAAGAIRPPARAAAGELRAAAPKPSAPDDKGALLLRPDRGAPLDPHASLLAKGAGGLGGTIARLQASLDRVEQRQATMLNSIENVYDFEGAAHSRRAGRDRRRRRQGRQCRARHGRSVRSRAAAEGCRRVRAAAPSHQISRAPRSPA